MKILMADHGVYKGDYKVGGQNLAECFSGMEHQVLYIGGLLNVFSFRHLLKNTYFTFTTKIMLNYWVKNGVQINNNLKVYTPFTILPLSKKVPFGNTDFTLNNTCSFTIPSLFKYLKKEKFLEPDILMVTPTSFMLLLEKLNSKVKVLRITDDVLTFQDIPEKIKSLFERALEKADFVFVSSLILTEKIKQKKKKNVFYLSNGVDFTFFQNADKNVPKEYENIKTKKVIYIGAIDYWFDVNLVRYLAESLKDINFFLIGSPKIDLFSLKGLSNIHILGIKSHEEIPKYLWNADVGIIPFKREPVIETVSPIKLYEYMACGLSTISTEWDELKVIKSPALLARSKEEFLSFLIETLSNSQDKAEYFKFAQENSWENKVKIIINYLYTYLS